MAAFAAGLGYGVADGVAVRVFIVVVQVVAPGLARRCPGRAGAHLHNGYGIAGQDSGGAAALGGARGRDEVAARHHRGWGIEVIGRQQAEGDTHAHFGHGDHGGYRQGDAGLVGRDGAGLDAGQAAEHGIVGKAVAKHHWRAEAAAGAGEGGQQGAARDRGE